MAASKGGVRSRKTAAKSGGGMTTFLFLATPASLFVAPTTVIMVPGLLPTMVAYIIDRDPDKTAPLTVGALNLCGTLPFAMDLWLHQHTLPAALHLLGDPLTWLVMYGAAAVGWAFYYLIPPIVTNVEVMRSEARIESLQRTKREMVAEWGPEVGAEDEMQAGQKTKNEGKGG